MAWPFFFGVAVGFGAAVFFGVAVALGVADGFGVAVAPAELLCEAPSGVLPGTAEEDAAGEDSGTAGAVPELPDASGPDEGRPPVPSRPNLNAATMPSVPTSTTPAALSATASPCPERYLRKKPSLPWRPRARRGRSPRRHTRLRRPAHQSP